MLILISDSFGPELPERLAPLGEVTTDPGRVAEADVVLVRSKTQVDRAYLDGAPKLKLVVRGGVGLDNIDLPYAESKGVEVRNTAAASAVAVAELAFALMIALPNHLVRADQSMRAGKWLKKELGRTELKGKTLGIVGMGNIGGELADRARAFGMTVESASARWLSGEVSDRRRFKETIGRCHYVSLHLPLTEKTRQVLDAEVLSWFRDGAYLINTARAEVLDDEAAATALRSGKLGGLATDVWITDPPDGSPLLDAPNTILTPHIGASTEENMSRIGEVVEEILRAHAVGHPS